MDKLGSRPRRSGVSIRDVAARAGVSLSTVSQVLNRNDKARIALATQEKVRRAARDLGYRPNELARGLVRGRTDVLGAMISALSNPYFVELLEAVEKHVQAAGYSSLLDSAPSSRGSYEGHGRLSNWPVDGVLMWTRDGHAASDFLGFGASGTPTVYMGGASRDRACDHVGFDLQEGARLLARHAIEKCKYLSPDQPPRIAHLMPYDFPRINPEEERLVGFGEVAREHGIEIETLLSPLDAETREAGFAAASLLLERPPRLRPRCVLCHNDVMALGLLAGLLRGGLRVPEEIALAGFDGIAEARFAPRALTTVACAPDEIARLGVERLLRRLDPECHDEPQHILLKPRLVPSETL